jgi:hypothetical protein
LLVLDHRYFETHKLVSKKTVPTDARMRMLAELLSTGKCADTATVRALEIYKSEYMRETLECLLLGGAAPLEIFSALKILPEVTDVYTYLFFDTSLFKDDLDRIAYAHSYTASKYGKELKKSAIELGAKTLLVRLSRGEYVVPPDAAHNSIRNTAFMLAQMAKVSPVDSKASQDAYRWAQLCLRSSENAPEVNKDAGDEINIAVTSRDETTNKESSGLDPKDILH